MTPVDAARVTDCLAAAAQRLDELAARLDRLWPCEQLLIERNDLVRARLIH